MSRLEKKALFQARECEATFNAESIRDAIRRAFGDRIVGEIAVEPPTLQCGARFVIRHDPEADAQQETALPRIEVPEGEGPNTSPAEVAPQGGGE